MAGNFPLTESMTFADAIERIRRTRKKKLYLEATVFMGCAPPAHEHTPRHRANIPGKTVSGLVEVTRASLIKFLLEATPEHWRPKLKLDISEGDHCLFIARARR